LNSKRGTNDSTTIFHSLLESDLPASEKTSERLAEEAILLAGAGTHTTAWAMTVATFYLLSQPMLLKKLKAELEEALPDSLAPVTLAVLEQLPYLTGVIKEGLRLSLGPSSRLPRIAIDKPIKFHGWEIPTGVPVSVTIPLVHLNEKIFPNPRAFLPERWTEDKTGRSS
jgi:cytochrome P450